MRQRGVYEADFPPRPAGAVFSLEWRDHEREAAKERQSKAGGDKSKALVDTFPQALREPPSRDKAGERVGLPSQDGILMRVRRIEQRAVQAHDEPATWPPTVSILLADDLDPDDLPATKAAAIRERHAIADPDG